MFVDLTYQRFGRLVVLKPEGRNKQGCVLWLCRCDCGAEKILNGADIRRGHQQSCGCGRSHRRKHGMSSTIDRVPEYTTWILMRKRCSNPNDSHYHCYGGRGISVCNRWDSFETFLSDMGPRPSIDHSLDRIDNDGNYEPSNCRWIPKRENVRHRRR